VPEINEVSGGRRLRAAAAPLGRLREKGAKAHAMPCHHTLEAYLHVYLDGTGIGDDAKGPLFRTIRRGTGQLSDTALPQANAYAIVRRARSRPGSARRSATTTGAATPSASMRWNAFACNACCVFRLFPETDVAV
jgi:hypothetical protein